jgi:hypothetical protein
MEQAPGREGLFCYLLPQSPEHFNELNNFNCVEETSKCYGRLQRVDDDEKSATFQC